MMDMRTLIQLLEATGQSGKLDRSAFLYLSPRDPKKQFAQCNTCFLFLPERQRCALFSQDFKVIADASCGLYINGQPNDNQEIRNIVSPKEAGYIQEQVRCENCIWFNKEPKTCGLFEDLNKAMPEVFDLEETVEPLACCNGWQPNNKQS
jgi:Pyruvate/2-oxoacid:ferredoxin oxidoreductase delta subunit